MTGVNTTATKANNAQACPVFPRPPAAGDGPGGFVGAAGCGTAAGGGAGDGSGGFVGAADCGTAAGGGAGGGSGGFVGVVGCGTAAGGAVDCAFVVT